MAVLSSQEIIGIGLQADIDTEAAAYNIVPVNTGGFSATETFENIMDTGRRGSEAMDYQAYAGVASTEITMEFPMMWGNSTGTTGSVLGILVRNLLGTGGTGSASSGSKGTQTDPYRAEIVDGTSAGNSTTWNSFFRLGNRATPEYLSIYRTLITGNAVDPIYVGCRVTEITISATSGEGPVMISATLTGRKADATGNEETGLLGTQSQDIALGWKNSLIATAAKLHGTEAGASTTPYQNLLLGNSMYNASLGNSANRMISFEMTMSREGTPVYSLQNNQNYQNIYLGPLEVTYNAVAQLDSTELARIRGFRTSSPDTTYDVRVAFSQGTAYDNDDARALVIGIADSTPLESPLEIDTSDSYATVAISGRALATGANLLLTDSSYDGSANYKRSPVEIQITEVGANNSTTPPTYS
tara:strand:- start:1061 stop:2305 length:1245 start_codon:yes stop_codon:yes gene_type:complete